MRKHIELILLVLLMLLGACSRRPSGVLSVRKMTNLLVELHMAEGTIQTANYAYGHDLEQQACYRSVLEKYGVTQAQFDSSLVWYTDHPLQFNRVYPKVLERLEAECEKYRQEEDVIKQNSLWAAQHPLKKPEEWLAEVREEQELWKFSGKTPYGLRADGVVEPLFIYGVRGDSQKAVFSQQDSIWQENFRAFVNDSVAFMASDSLSTSKNIEKSSPKTCENEKKVVPLHPLSNKGDAMLLRKRD